MAIFDIYLDRHRGESMEPEPPYEGPRDYDPHDDLDYYPDDGMNRYEEDEDND
jgi:hypothetical protein